MFRFFQRYKQEETSDVKLVLIGSSKLIIPAHPDIVHLGFLSEEDKFSGLEGALMLMMPSFYESLSMVTLEAWAIGKPVLANAKCEVLKGQCMRSNAGLFYEDYFEFHESFRLLLRSPRLRETLGKNGKRFFRQHYTWDVIESKYLSILDHLEKEQ
jgi:glycosyltransferase involved in cell wall biosynthesis